METYFYERISTAEERELQSYQRQDKALRKYAKENNLKISDRNTYKDDVTGSTFNRTEWKELGIKLVFLDNPTVSTDYISNMISKNESMNFVTGIALQSMVNLLIAVELDRAEQQRLYISKSITDGIAASDKKSGRPKGKLDKMSDSLREDIKQYVAIVSSEELREV